MIMNLYGKIGRENEGIKYYKLIVGNKTHAYFYIDSKDIKNKGFQRLTIWI